MEIAPRSAELAPPPPQEENSWEFIAFAWRRKWIVLLLLVVGVSLGVLYHLRARPVFESVARVLIVRGSVKFPVEGVELSSSYDSTHETLICSPLVLEKAVQDHLDIAGVPSLRESGNAIATIMSALEVQGIGGETGDILELRYRSSVRHDCSKVLQSVVNAYQAFLGDTQAGESEDAIDLISKASEQLETQIQAAQEEFQRFRNEASLLYAGESAQNFHESRMARIEEARSGVMLSLRTIKAETDALLSAVERGGNREALEMLVGRLREESLAGALRAKGAELVGRLREESLAAADRAENGENTSASGTVEEQLFPMLLEEKMLLETYGPDHPQVQTVRKRIEMTRSHLLLSQSADDEEDAEEPVDLLDVYVLSLNEQMRISEQTIADLNNLFDEEREAARKLADEQAMYETKLSAIQRKEDLQRAVIKRLEELNLSLETRGPRLELIHKPGLGKQVEPDLAKNLLLSSLIGLLAGLGLAFVVDAADRRFGSAEEIQQDFGVPVIGHIPVIPFVAEQANEANGDQPISPALRVYHQPRGRIAEAYRAVRTALYFSARGTGHRVIQVTSPNPGDGKTTLAANLAVSIAQSDKKVLLIDCDFRRPRCHRFFGGEESTGMTSVLEGKAEIGDAVKETPVENLWILPCGPHPDNPSELLTSRRFEELLDVLREQYDLVIVDTPPVLIVTDPLTVAPRVDAVLVVMRLSKNARALGRRAMLELDAVGANVSGIVVNRIAGGAGRYGRYAEYAYGYGYGQGYKYGYGYGYSQRYGTYRGYGRYGEQASTTRGYGSDDDRRYVDDDDGKTSPEGGAKGVSVGRKGGTNGQE